MINIINDKRAQILTGEFNWFSIIIICFVAILFFAGLIYVMGLLNTAFTNVGLQNDAANPGASCNTTICNQPGETVPPGYVNLSIVSQETFGIANQAIQNLRLVALTLVFSLIAAAIIVNFLIRKIHPVFFFVYVLIIVLAIMLSAMISNAYQTELTSRVFGGILPSFTGVNWIMINFPTVVAVGGILGGIFLFINIVRGQDERQII